MIHKIIRAAIYARKSNDDDYKCADNKSITRQIEHGKAYADEKGWTVSDANIFIDDGISGAEFKNRPGLNNLRNRINEYDVIIMSELSRLGRDGDRTSYEIIDFIENGKRIFYYLTDEEEKANDATSKFMLRVKSFAAEIEREKASQRVTDALHRRAAKGYVVSSPVYGYDIVAIESNNANGEKVKSHSEYRINEDEKEVVTAIFEMYRDGIGYHRIAKILNGSDEEKYIEIRKKYLNGKIPSPPKRKNSNGWSSALIRQILRREKYAGLFTYGKTESTYKGGSKAVNKRENYIEVEMPELRIIKKKLWTSVQKRIKETEDAYKKSRNGNYSFQRSVGNERDSKYLLTGLSECSICGSSLVTTGGTTGSKNNRKPDYRYGCSGRHNKGSKFCSNDHRVKMEDFDKSVITAIENQVLSKTTIDYVINKASEIISKSNTDTDYKDNIKKEIKKIEKELDKLILLAQKTDNIDIVAEKINEKKVQYDNLSTEVEKVVSIEKNRDIDKTDIRTELEKRMKNISGLFTRNISSTRKALKILLKNKIIVKPVTRNGKKAIKFSGVTTVGALTDEYDDENHIGLSYPW